MNNIRLKKHHDKRIRNGHHWVFSNEIHATEGDPAPGETVSLYDASGAFMGVGFYNPSSLIAFRLLSKEAVQTDVEFFEQRLHQAIQLRARTRPDANLVRLLHGESDRLPGLIVDRVGDVLSVQVLSAGMELHLEAIVGLLDKLVEPTHIILRNESALRELEGLPLYTKLAKGNEPVPLQEVTEHGVKYSVDMMGGQKTGFFIDQHENRRVFAGYISEGDKVLDAFCNEGGFALQAARAGAGEVLALDISESALQRADTNARLNQVEKRIRFERADLMKWLPESAAKEDQLGTYDVVNLDPPGFAKNRKTAGAALKGYQKLHQAAIALLKDGGFLATATCSHHIDTDRFLETVAVAARKNGREAVMLHRGSQPSDHPVLTTMKETEYLRFFVFQVRSL